MGQCRSTAIPTAEDIRDKPHQQMDALVIHAVEHLSLVFAISDDATFQEGSQMLGDTALSMSVDQTGQIGNGSLLPK